MAKNKNNVQIIDFEAFRGAGAGESIGHIKFNATELALNYKIIKVESSALTNATIAASNVGAAPTLNLTMLQTTHDELWGDMASGQMVPYVDGAKLAYGVGSRAVDLIDLSEPLRLHPASADADDFSGDYYFWLASPDLSQVTITGNRDGEQEVQVPFTIFQDDTKGLDHDIGLFGDWTATLNADPYTMFISTEHKARAPYNHDGVLTLESDQVKRVYTYGFYKTNTSVTFDINDVGDVAAVDVIIEVDTISTANGLAVGDYFLIGTELMKITAITYSTTTAASITVNRHIAGTTAAIHLDNATATKLENVFVIPMSSRATWASSVVADVTVGDSNLTGNKGLLTWVSDGTSNITAVVGSTTSGTLAVTTST